MPLIRPFPGSTKYSRYSGSASGSVGSGTSIHAWYTPLPLFGRVTDVTSAPSPAAALTASTTASRPTSGRSVTWVRCGCTQLSMALLIARYDPVNPMTTSHANSAIDNHLCTLTSTPRRPRRDHAHLAQQHHRRPSHPPGLARVTYIRVIGQPNREPLPSSQPRAVVGISLLAPDAIRGALGGGASSPRCLDANPHHDAQEISPVTSDDAPPAAASELEPPTAPPLDDAGTDPTSAPPPDAPAAARSGGSVTLIRVLSWIVIAAGAILIVAGVTTWFVVRDQLADEKITVSADADHFAGDSVDGPLTAFSQADTINHHALEASGGKTYAELSRTTRARQTVMTASFLRASLFTSVVSFGVAAFAAGIGLLMLIIGFVLLKVDAALARLSAQPATA